MFTTMQYAKRLFRATLGLMLLALVLAGCTGSQPVTAPTAVPEEPTAEIPAVTIEVNDDGFVIPDDFPGGIVEVTVQNTGSKDMDVSLARVRDGASVDEIKALFADQEANLIPLLQLASAMPSFNPVVAGGSEHAIIDFRTGHFLVAANEHVEEMAPPGTEYLFGEFTADELVGTVEPQADVTVDMHDFAYTMPDSITAGEHLWEFANTGQQWHMLLVLKLAPDATMEDVMNAFTAEGEPAGPPPFEIVNGAGLAPISEGERVWLEFSLEPGSYVVACPIPDLVAMMNGEPPLPHMMKGMIQQLTVSDDASAATTSAVPAVTIVARDYAFDMPATLPAGLVSLTLKNEGAVNHHAIFTQVEDGTTLEQMQAMLASDGEDDTGQGGDQLVFALPDTDPGSSNEATVTLAPGTWAVFSVSMGDMADPTPDWAKGSLNLFTVEDRASDAAAPQPDLVLTVGADDADMPAELQAGPHTIQVVNASGQADGWAFFIKLEGDATVADILAMFDALFSGQEPAKMAEFHAVGGLMMGYNLSDSFYTTVDFAPGNYAVITSIGVEGFPYSGLAKSFTVK